MRTPIKYYSLLLICLSLFIQGCKNGKPTEGTIVYDIEYPEMQDNNFLIALMPQQMTFYFRDNQFASVLSAKADQLTIQLIGNSNTYTVEQTFKFGTQLIRSSLTKEEVSNINLKEYGKINTEFTDTTNNNQMIGLEVKKATLTGDKIPTQEVVYTDKIEFKDPNWTYPFPDIPGIPLAYEIDRMGLKMKLTAISFSTEPVEDSVFVISNNYKQVDYSLFEKEIRTLLDSFMDLGS